LRISAPISFGSQKLVPALNDYLDRYPEIEIDVALSDDVVDLAGAGFDAAIRIGVLPGSRLIARPLAPVPRIICASPGYIARFGAPRTPDELARHNCLAFAYTTGRQRDWQVRQPDGSSATVQVGGRLTIDSVQALRMAALSGIGIVMQPLLLVADDLATGRLVRLLPDYPMPNGPVHIVYLPDRQMTPKLASFIDFAREKFG
jgi:DNA-binding transcriptional LysR family regulator